VVWTQNVFEPGGNTLGSLVEQTKNQDFAIFVVDADDTTASRTEVKKTTRDNVLFELGLFLGALGITRSFMIYNREQKPDLASDLSGVTPVTYAPHDSGNIDAALGAAVSYLAAAMIKRGPVQAETTTSTTQQEAATTKTDAPEPPPFQSVPLGLTLS
jgi:predicted nucleotide-binding protein